MNRAISSAIVLFSFAVTSAVNGQAPGGFIENIRGKVTLLSARGSQTLDPDRDRGLILNSGDKLDCPSGSVATGFLTGPSLDLKTPVNLCGKQIFAAEPTQKGVSAEAVTKLQQYALAGRSKGNENPIFSPPDHGSVLAEKFIIQWRTRPPLDNFTAVLQDGGTEIAHVSDVDGTTGELDSPVLRHAVVSVRNASSPTDELRLLLRFGNGSQQISTFTVLSAPEESRLQEELAEVPGAELFKFVERAAIYDSFHLYDQVASEYESALALAPESRSLLRAAMQAYSQVGNLRRARELRDKLHQLETESR
jgi:hypothetical protein